MAIRLPAALRTARAQEIVDRAGTGARIRIYTGSQPAPDAAATGTLLAELTITGALGTITNGVLTLGSITGDSAADATGTAGWFRIVNSAGSVNVLDGSASGSGGGGDMILNSTSVVAGQTVNITSAVLTDGGA